MTYVRFIYILYNNVENNKMRIVINNFQSAFVEMMHSTSLASIHRCVAFIK